MPAACTPERGHPQACSRPRPGRPTLAALACNASARVLTPAGGARQVCVDAGSALHVPDSLSDHEAAGLMEATLTAYLNIFELGGARPGQLVLIHGGGSGVGTQARRPSTSAAGPVQRAYGGFFFLRPPGRLGPHMASS